MNSSAYSISIRLLNYRNKLNSTLFLFFQILSRYLVSKMLFSLQIGNHFMFTSFKNIRKLMTIDEVSKIYDKQYFAERLINIQIVFFVFFFQIQFKSIYTFFFFQNKDVGRAEVDTVITAGKVIVSNNFLFVSDIGLIIMKYNSRYLTDRLINQRR